MAQVTLPNSIDAGTAAAAAEVQQNFVALRDTINGDLEGGTGNNLKADGITARELQDTLLQNVGANNGLQEGVFGSGDFKVTPGAGLALNWAAGGAFIDDDTGVVGTGTRVPAVAAAGSSVTIAANASGNPRLDQIVLTLTGWRTGTVSVVQGTPNAATTIDTRTGAAALPASAIRLADILMPSGFAGPFVQATHIRDRRPWARGAFYTATAPIGADYSINSTTFVDIDATNLKARLEFSGAPVRLMFLAEAATAGGVTARFSFLADGGLVLPAVGVGATARTPVIVEGIWVPSAGSHVVGPTSHNTAAGTHTVYRSTTGSTPQPLMVVQEILTSSVANTGA